MGAGKEKMHMENILKFLTPKSRTACIDDRSTVRQALEKMRYHGYNALPVIDAEGKYVGTVTEGDFLWHMVLRSGRFSMRAQENTPVRDILRPDWNPAVPATTTMDALFEKVKERNFAPVVDDRGCFIGLITRRDVLTYFAKLYMDAEKRDPV